MSQYGIWPHELYTEHVLLLLPAYTRRIAAQARLQAAENARAFGFLGEPGQTRRRATAHPVTEEQRRRTGDFFRRKGLLT